MSIDSIENVLITCAEDDVRTDAPRGLGHARSDELGVLLAAAFRLAASDVPRTVMLRGRPVRMRISLPAGTVVDREPLARQLITSGVRDDVGAVTVGQHDHVGGLPRRGRCRLQQVRQRAYPHRGRAGHEPQPPREQDLPVRRDDDPAATHEGIPPAGGQSLGGALIGAELSGFTGGISPGHIPCILPVSRRIRHCDRGGHHVAGPGRAGLKRAQPGVQLQPAEPEERKLDHRRVWHAPITAGRRRAGQRRGAAMHAIAAGRFWPDIGGSRLA